MEKPDVFRGLKLRVHNIMEAKALVKERNASGEVEDYIEWYTHDGKFLGSTELNQQTMEMEW
jgi:hypothetical protein